MFTKIDIEKGSISPLYENGLALLAHFVNESDRVPDQIQLLQFLAMHFELGQLCLQVHVDRRELLLVVLHEAAVSEQLPLFHSSEITI